jgi:hypothetical protein
MSLAIDVEKVTAVLLPDREWHRVKDRIFDFDAYEFLHQRETTTGGGTVNGVPSTGAKWKEIKTDEWVTCPLT